MEIGDRVIGASKAMKDGAGIIKGLGIVWRSSQVLAHALEPLLILPGLGQFQTSLVVVRSRLCCHRLDSLLAYGHLKVIAALPNLSKCHAVGRNGGYI